MSNMDNAFNLPIRITYRLPRSVLYFSVFNHAGAVACLFISSIPIPFQLALGSVVLYHLAQQLGGYRSSQSGQGGQELCLRRDDTWLLVEDGKTSRLQLCPGALVHRLVVLMRFKTEEGNTARFILTAENVDKQILRRLRVRMLHGRAAYAVS